MASNPPYQVEDQTDEDFFDKLVEDDVDGAVKSRQDEGNESDDAKAFANLGIIDDDDDALDSADIVNSEFHDKGQEDLREGLVASPSLSFAPQPSPAPSSAIEPSSAPPTEHAEKRVSSVPSSSVGCNNAMDTSNNDLMVSDSTMTVNSNGSSGSGVKEVGWNSFYADSTQNGAAGSASYSDFFGGLEDNLGDFNGETIGHVNEIRSDSLVRNNNLNSSISYSQQHSEGQAYDASYQQITNVQGLSVHSAETAVRGEIAGYDENQKLGDSYGSHFSVQKEEQNLSNSCAAVPPYGKTTQTHGMINETKFQSFVPGGNLSQQFNSSNFKHEEPTQYPSDYVGGDKHINYSQKAFQNVNQSSHVPQTGRSPDGRPLHALVTFGFGGKLIVMKDSSLMTPSYASQESVQCSISVLNLMEVIMGNGDASNNGSSSCGYFGALCHQSFPGPLIWGGVRSKDLYKWIDERIASCESPDTDFRKSERLRLLSGLLKIAFQHYGKLRSPFGTDTILRENDNPESAVAELFASAKRSSQLNEYGLLSQCLQYSPSEGKMLATASEVQNLLISGRKMEALQCAREGQLWGPALVLASKLGDQSGANSMLDDWEEILAVITANRTKDDELVIVHLGDCLWKDRSEVTAAHICYLVAEANFELYSDSARLCLIGADHWKFPRTFASPEAIQRTELYEYSKVLGNYQSMLLPFQPYKLIYAYMLAEVGKVSDSLKYCQSVLKILKTCLAPEVEKCEQLVSSLEERIKVHRQVFGLPRFGSGIQRQSMICETSFHIYRNYDKKLKRWVKEGAEPRAEKPALAPPPTTFAFQDASPEYNLKSALKMEGSPSNENPSVKDSISLEHSPGTPPIPPTSNQFSSRGRMGLLARYVDKFNRFGRVPAKWFQSPSTPPLKPASVPNAKFCIPTPPSANQNTVEATAESVQEDSTSTVHSSTSFVNDPFQSNTIPRFPC